MWPYEREPIRFKIVEPATIPWIQLIRTITSVRISDETKKKLDAIKRDGETFEDLLDRLAVSRTLEDVEALAGFADEGVEEHMNDNDDELSDSLEEISRRPCTPRRVFERSPLGASSTIGATDSRADSRRP